MIGDMALLLVLAGAVVIAAVVADWLERSRHDG